MPIINKAKEDQHMPTISEPYSTQREIAFRAGFKPTVSQSQVNILDYN